MHKKILFSIILILSIIFISIFLILKIFLNQYISLSNSTQISNHLSNSPKNTINNDLLIKIKELSNLANQYKKHNSTSDSQIELCLQFIRRDTYNNTDWNISAGPINSDFINFVQEKNIDLFNYDFNNTKFIDPKTNNNIDFIHMCAYLNSILFPSVIPSDFSGWAGDLVTLMGEVINYDNDKTDEELLNFAKKNLGTIKNSSTFGISDMLADVDALLLSELKYDNFYDLIYFYYYTNNNMISNRKYHFKNYLENDIYSAVQKRFSGIINQTIILQILTTSQGETYQNNSEKYNNIMAQTFYNYFFN